jgi:hypothetical protein
VRIRVGEHRERSSQLLLWNDGGMKRKINKSVNISKGEKKNKIIWKEYCSI